MGRIGKPVPNVPEEPKIRTLHSKRKGCICGNHHGGAKSNKRHHATRIKLRRRKAKKAKKEQGK